MYGTTTLGGGVQHRSPNASGPNFGAVGGTVVEFVAAATTLLIGDAVYITAVDSVGGQVDKSATAANYQAAAGIVVGGESTYMQVGTLSTDVGLTAATSGKRVLVQVNGKAWGIADGTVAVGAPVGVGAAGAAGRLEDTTVASAGQTIGTSLGAGTVGAAMLILISHR